jgi:hypothetical protein
MGHADIQTTIRYLHYGIEASPASGWPTLFVWSPRIASHEKTFRS